MTNDTLAIITCSYGPDAHRCRRLCRSIDRFVPEHIEHCVIVPHRDYSLFADLHGGRRRVLATEDIVPGGFTRLPLARKWWLGPGGWPVRGWIMQQITKLSANYAVDAELLQFADSDLEFVRPFDLSLIHNGTQLRLHLIPGASCQQPHLSWHHRAAKLLGVEARYFGSDYVGQLITWRRSNLAALQQHLEATHAAPWYQPISRSLQFSEYILYGAYSQHILGEAANGHFYCPDDICHCCWFAEDAERLGNGEAAISNRAQAILLQSNLGLKPQQEAAVLLAARNHINPLTPQGT
jgi:hypothetical protein